MMPVEDEVVVALSGYLTEQLGRHRVQRSVPFREAKLIALVNRRFVIDDQNTHPAIIRLHCFTQ
jgi:hypothetical protein